jgi:two-component system, NtrC family, nitrogen regulation response regulator NtrX
MTAPHILVVDDEPDIRVLIREILEDENYRVTVAENGTAARQAWLADPPDLLLLDIWMPDIDGISLLREWTQSNPHSAPVIMVSGHGTVETAVQATRLGAFDYIEKPLSTAKLLLTVEKALASPQVNASTGAGEFAAARSEPIGKSPLIANLREQASRLAVSTTPILLIGELGCGKSLFARYIHAHSLRREAPFLKVNIAALAPDSQEAALFGKEIVHDPQLGALRQARGGTVFLDRIEALTPNTQHRLYRYLEIERAKSAGEPNPTSPRLLTATSVDLAALVQTGRFREDLYYWLSTLSLSIPPLRDRCEDIPELLNYFVDLLVEQEGLPYRHFSVAAQNRLRNYAWPGNVHELRNLVRRLLIVGESTEIDLAEAEASLEPIAVAKTPLPIDLGLPLREAREQFERLYLEHKLRETGGNVGKAAKLVEMERTHLYRKLRALGIDTKQLSSQE